MFLSGNQGGTAVIYRPLQCIGIARDLFYFIELGCQKPPFDTLIFIGVRAIGRIVISAVLQCSRIIFYGMEGYCERKITGNQRGGTAAD